ncbi:MAG: bifunctional pyr operon transcriptional regulator/uracil phosphoribosyltransferase [Crocinitomicaceae bacterium]|nr:bifunctional pyr operon transcriptional regulator/uracil phosphoribosyltransferase [Crocinitomicaceae bacterium]|tara:strand:+ start:1213 stop:1758 length:546 start_codon:yes stop_codon:yes gene_type:complete
MDSQVLINEEQFALILDRLAHQLLEHHDFSETDLVGLQPRGTRVAERLAKRLSQLLDGKEVRCGALDVTFHRDDLRRREKPIAPQENIMEFLVEGRKVILVDDVLFTGRTIRAGLDALLSYGRPNKVELAVLVDRRFTRELPIEPTYIGTQIDSISDQHVVVEWAEENSSDRVILFNSKPE